MQRGHFATKNECEKARVKMAREAGDRMLLKYSECVGCDEQNSSRTQQGRTVIIGGPTNRTPEEEEMVGRARRTRNPRAALEAMKKEQEQRRLDEEKEQQSRAEFERGKRGMLSGLKGGSADGDLHLKGGETKLALKSGNVPINNQKSAREEEIRKSAREEDIRKTKQRLKVLKTDVALMQSQLRFYQESLLKNVSTLDQQAEEITKRNSELLYDGAQYFLSVASGRFLKLKSKSKFTEKMRKKYEEFLKVIDKYKEIKEKKKKIDWLVNTPNGASKLIEGGEMLAKDSLENIAEELYDTEDIPLLNHVMINYKAWTAVGKGCVNWIKIKDANRGIEDDTMAAQAVSLQFQWAMEDINCLSKCIAESHDNCIKKCSR